MSKILTPREALRAIADGEKLEYKQYGDERWYTFVHRSTPVFVHFIVRGNYIFRLAEETMTVGCVQFRKPRIRVLTHLKRLFS